MEQDGARLGRDFVQLVNLSHALHLGLAYVTRQKKKNAVSDILRAKYIVQKLEWKIHRRGCPQPR